MSSISFVKASITDLDCDAIVNAANDRLMYGGVSVAVFSELQVLKSLKRSLRAFAFVQPVVPS